MTINTSVNRVTYVGNGATTVWTYSFLIPDPTELVVSLTDTTTGIVTVLTSGQYSVTGINNPAGGTVTYSPALATGNNITIQRILPVVQGTSLSNQGAFYPAVVETALDYLTMVCQQLNDSVGRSLVVSATGVATVDAQSNRIINLLAGINGTDAVNVTQLQAQYAATGNVPSPTLPQVGQYLKATAAGVFAWAVAQVTSANITDSTAAGRTLLTSASATTQRSALGIGDTGPMALRNRIFNGAFEIYQRGLITTAWTSPVGGFYLADRWYGSTNGTGGTGTMSQQFFTIGQTLVPGEPVSFLRWQITVAPTGQTTGNCLLEQRIEDVRTFAGKTCTLSFYAAGVGTLPSINLIQNFGTGGSPSASVSTALVTNLVLPGAGVWTKYTYTVTLPSIAGKTFGNTGNNLSVNFQVPLNSTFTFDLSSVQLEEGSTATPFEFRPRSIELELCQRYYEKPDVAYAEGWACPSTGGYSNVTKWQWKVRKRTVPTVTTNITSTVNFASSVLLTNALDGFTYSVTGSAATNTSWNWQPEGNAEL